MNINEPDRIDGFHWFVMNGWKHADSWMKVPVNKGMNFKNIFYVY